MSSCMSALAPVSAKATGAGLMALSTVDASPVALLLARDRGLLLLWLASDGDGSGDDDAGEVEPEEEEAEAPDTTTPGATDGTPAVPNKLWRATPALAVETAVAGVAAVAVVAAATLGARPIPNCAASKAW